MNTTTKPRVGLLIASTRHGRIGELPFSWMKAICHSANGFESDAIDLRDFPMPLFNDRAPPSAMPSQDANARQWTASLERVDGLIVITPEYNHGPPAVLKNAFDHVAGELARKPIGFVGYGTLGAARAIEQLRLTAIELDMVPLRAAVHIGPAELDSVLSKERGFGGYPHLALQADRLIRHMSWWANLLSADRRRVEQHTPG